MYKDAANATPIEGEILRTGGKKQKPPHPSNPGSAPKKRRGERKGKRAEGAPAQKQHAKFLRKISHTKPVGTKTLETKLSAEIRQDKAKKERTL